MRRAIDAADYLRAPVGAYLEGRNFLYFRPHEGLSGYLVLGRPEPDDFWALSRVLPPNHPPPVTPHPMILDCREMEAFAADVFAAAIKWTKDNFADLRRTVTKIAVVRPDTVVGAIAAGFFAVTPSFSPVRMFSDPAEAFAWIDRADDATLFEQLAELRGAGTGGGFIQAFRRLLDEDLSLTLEETARRLSVSPRTLQRRLGELNTNLRTEVAHARVRRAEALLLETDASVTDIAFRVGCASAQHFSMLFRSVTGESPSAWRAKRRGV